MLHPFFLALATMALRVRPASPCGSRGRTGRARPAQASTTAREWSASLQASGPSSVATTMSSMRAPNRPAQVDARLDREGVPGHERRRVPGHHVGVLVLLDPDAVADAVDEAVAVAGGRDRRRARRGRPPRRPCRRRRRRRRRPGRGSQHLVELGELALGLAGDDRAGDVRAVADAVAEAERAAEVADDDLARADAARAGLVVRAGRVGPAPDDGEVHPVVALLDEARARSRRRPRPRSGR